VVSIRPTIWQCFSFLIVALLPVTVLAVPPEVANVTFTDENTMAWDFVPGTKGYNLYHTTRARAAVGDYGDCHVGSHRTTSLVDFDEFGPGEVHMFLVTSFDETGEGSAGPAPSGGNRVVTTPCVPALRYADFVQNGDTEDGVFDGVEPARNPSLGLYVTSNEMSGVYLHTGEVFLSVIDLEFGARGMQTRSGHMSGMNVNAMNMNGMNVNGMNVNSWYLNGAYLKGPGYQLVSGGDPYMSDNFGSQAVTLFPRGVDSRGGGSIMRGSILWTPYITVPGILAAAMLPNILEAPVMARDAARSPSSKQLFTSTGDILGLAGGDIFKLGSGEGGTSHRWDAPTVGPAHGARSPPEYAHAADVSDLFHGGGNVLGLVGGVLKFGGSDVLGNSDLGGSSGSWGQVGSTAGDQLIVPCDSLLNLCNAYFANDQCDLYYQCHAAYRECANNEDAGYNVEVQAASVCGKPEPFDLGIGKSTLQEAFPSGPPRRTYRNQISYNGPLGHGWDHPANQRLEPSGGDVTYYNGAGRADLFPRTSSTTFDSSPGIYDILIQNPDDSFTRRQPDGTLHNYHAFDGSNMEGAVESVEDRNGNFTSYLYDNQGLLTTVVDTMGRSITYGYDVLGRITSITDFAGREVQYGYDANGDLVTVGSPVVPGTFPLGKVTTYEYTSGSADERLNHNLMAIIRPNEEVSGLPAIQMSYGSGAGGTDFDRVVAQTIGGDDPGGGTVGGTLSYSYEFLNESAPPDADTPRRGVTVFDRNGNQMEFVHNAAGNLLSHTAFTNRDLRPAEPDYTTLYSYNGEGELLEAILPEGNRVQLTYDALSPNHGSQGNLLEVRAIADSRGDGRGGSLADRVWTFTYEPVFNQLICSTDPRGNDPDYVPQNGGAQSAARYSSCRSYCYMEQSLSTNGIEPLAARFGIDLGTVPQNLGDLNGDGRTDQAGGNLVKLELPTVQLDPLSQQAAIEGDISQEIVALYQWNDLGQPVTAIDPEGNRHEYEYYPEIDPDGDGVGTTTPDDGRVLHPTTGGYLRTVRFDTTSATGRNNSTDPTPTNIQYDYEYDEVGNVTGVVGPRGVLTRFVVNELNQVEEVHRAAATSDASGPGGDPPTGRGEPGLTPFGFITRYAYDANENLVLREVEDRNETRSLGPFITTSWTYDLLDNPLSVAAVSSKNKNLVTQFAYDANENRIEVTQPEGNTHEWSWDERDLLLTRTVGASGLRGGVPAVYAYEYDGYGNLTRFTDALGELVDVAYDGSDRPVTVANPIGNTVDSIYDPASNVTRSLYRGPIGGPTPADRSGSSNEDLAETLYLYDELNRMFRSDHTLFVPAGVIPARTPILAEGPLVPSDGAINTTWEYDRLSRLSFKIRDSGETTTYDYDGYGRSIGTRADPWENSTFTWDDASNLIETEGVENPSNGAGGPPAETFLTTSFFDALGRPEMVVNNVGETWRWGYDSLNQVIGTSDPRGPDAGVINRRSPGHLTETIPINVDGNITEYTYDGAGRLLTTVQILTPMGEGDGTIDPTPDDTNPFNPDGLITSTTVWDDNSLPAAMSDDRDNQTSYSYDNLNRLVEVMADDETVTQYSYDTMGNVTAVTDANGSDFLNTYDAAHRLIAVEVTPAAGVVGTTEQSFEYDGLNRPTLTTDNNDPGDPDDDVTTTMFYDSLSRLIEEGQQIGSGAGVEVLTTDYGWLAGGLLTDLIYPDGRHIQTSYDGAERVTSILDLDPTASEGASFDYFGLGRVHTRTYNSGLVTTMLDDAGTTDIGFDGVKRITLLRHVDPAAGTEHAAFEYRYDRASNPTSHRRLHHGDGSGNFMGEIYTYDSANRLTSFEESFMDVDHLGIVLVPPDDAIVWTLDGTHNWAEMTRNGIAYASTPNNRDQYNEDQSGGVATDDGVLDDFWDDVATADPDGLNFAYDENGNTKEDGYNVLSFDAFNRLIRAERDDGSGTLVEIARYTYDAMGRRVTRVAEVAPGVMETRRYIHAGSTVIEERDLAAGGIARQIVYGGGPLWQVLGDGTSQYLLEDPMGSVVGLFDGGVVERVTYDPYGKPQFESPGNVALTDASGNFAPSSQFSNRLLWHALWYNPELGERTADINLDWGGCYLIGGGVNHYNPNTGRIMNVYYLNIVQQTQLMSNMLKTDSDSKMAIIRNLK
jgi:YD repeat-containing protein